jgi:hypothetical protein
LCLLCGDYNSAPKLTWPRRAIAVTASVLAYAALIIVAIAIVVFGWAGEVLSIQALYNHGPAGKPTLWALWAVIVLTAAVVIPPFLRFARDRMVRSSLLPRINLLLPAPAAPEPFPAGWQRSSCSGSFRTARNIRSKTSRRWPVGSSARPSSKSRAPSLSKGPVPKVPIAADCRGRSGRRHLAPVATPWRSSR